MSKNDYYSLVICRGMQGLLVLACLYTSLPVILSGYNYLESYQIRFREMHYGNLCTLFSIIGFYYGVFLVIKILVKVIFNKPKIRATIVSYICLQTRRLWIFYLFTGGMAYIDGVDMGDISISAFRSFLILLVFTLLGSRLNQVYDQSIITNYALNKQQRSLKYLTYIGFEKVAEDLIMTPHGNIPVERISYYYHIERTPFTMTVSRGSYKLASFYRCILNLTLSFLVFYLSINGMIEEQNILRYLGLLLMSLLLVIVEAPTSYELLKKVKKIFLSYQKKGKG
ncbi:hypothetical protein IGJ22_002687 [Enterococcus sp. DIV0448]|uniref:hypothetical protein n=1 Tax=Enterococcus TaxID=1350 RepID=UPI0019FF020C|nr:hypothetical protein [Enterococcus hirae]EMF0208391.1 hypothetical protein [Enterococcus hirae]EMF0226343.1 hypothetical protein [Enterococcus hirae]